MDNNMNNNPNNENLVNEQSAGGQPQQGGIVQPSTVYNYDNPAESTATKKKMPGWAIALIAVGGVLIIVLIIVIIVCAVFIGKVTNTNTDAGYDDYSYVYEDTEAEIDTSEEVSEETEEITEEKTEEVSTEAASTSAPVVSGELASTLDSLQIQLDGEVYTIPFDYSLISDKYSFDLADYGYPDGYILNPRGSVSTTIDLESDTMDESCWFEVGFMNTDSEAQDIKLCDISGLTVDISFCKSDSYPQLVCPGGITWGSTYDEVVAAYGECEDPYFADGLNYYVLEYQLETDDYLVYWKFYTYEDGGVKKISITCY